MDWKEAAADDDGDVNHNNNNNNNSKYTVINEKEMYNKYGNI